MDKKTLSVISHARDDDVGEEELPVFVNLLGGEAGDDGAVDGGAGECPV
jgi:hypothetical protein